MSSEAADGGHGAVTPAAPPPAAQDCLGCRVTGTAVCLGASAYLTAHHYARPSPSPTHRVLTLAVAGGFAAMAIVRAFI